MTTTAPVTDTLTARLLAVEDRLDLAELLARYARGIDTENYALLADVVTPDMRAEHGAVTPPLESRDAWFEVLRLFSPRFRHARHHVTNIEVELDGDRAVVRALLVCVHDLDLDGAPALVPVGADYEFTAVRTAAGWRFGTIVVHETWQDPRVPRLYQPGGVA